MFLAGVAFSGWWLWKVVLANGTIYWRGHWSMIVGPVVLGTALSVIVISLYWGSRLGRLLFANPVVYFLGLISYSVYLWHFVVLQQAGVVFGSAWTNLGGLPKFLASLALVVLVSAISYFVFERPFFRLRGKRKTQKSGA